MPASFLPVIDFLKSLKLTVALLVMGIVLVVIATLDQVNLGIWAVQAKYFRSFIVFSRLPGSDFALPVFPGGYLVGGLLLINLLLAQFHRFALTWRNFGLHLTHFGIILLLVGELFTGLFAVESDMTLNIGDTRNYIETRFRRELAVADVTDPATNRVWAVPMARLDGSTPIALPGAPFDVVPLTFHGNARLFSRAEAPMAPASGATAGAGTAIVLQSQPVFNDPEKDSPASLVELRAGNTSIGTWLVSLDLPKAQTFTHAGRTYEIALRRKRIYLPFALTLLDMTHETYPGTDIPKNFASRVRVLSADGRENREVRLFMNNPLRHGGYAFYQLNFQNNDRTIAYQVMANPGWLLPYVACIMSGLGLVIHFSITLAGFIGRRRAAAGRANPGPDPAVAGGVDPGQPASSRPATGGAK